MSRRKNADRDRRKPTAREHKAVMQVNAALRAAEQAIQAERWQDASTLITAILEAAPDEPVALLLAGRMALAMVPRGVALEMDLDGAVLSQVLVALSAAEQSIAAAKGRPWADAHWLRATALTRLGRFEEAAEACEAALKDGPKRPEIWTDYGSTLNALGRWDEALQAWARARTLPGADLAAIDTNEGPVRVLLGDWSGWNLYERRLDAVRFKADVGRPYVDRPRWEGEPMPGETLLVYAEQGLGDSVIMWRYLPWVVERSGARVLLEVHGQLTRLALEIPGVVVVAFGQPMPTWHKQVSLMSLPALHGSTPATVPRARAA